MTRPQRLVLLVWPMLLAACETTGDPREGGLFGWSETKARERQTQKQADLARAESDLERESRRTAALSQRSAGAAREISTAQKQKAAATSRATQSAHEHFRAQQSALAAKAAKLEEDSPTAATGSRARALRTKVYVLAGNASLTPAQRVEQMRQLDGEIDEARAKLSR